MKKTLVLLPGELNGVFVKNEYSYLHEFFDNIYILGTGNQDTVEFLTNKYSFNIILLKKFSIRKVLKYFLWIFSSESIQEIKNNFSLNKKGFYKLAYSAIYGIAYINSKDEIRRILDKNDCCYLYSFWFSRPAFVLAHFSKHKNVKRSITRAHGFDVYLERNKYSYLPFREYIMKNIDEISFISKQGEKYFLNHYNCLCKTKVSQLGTLCDRKSDIHYDIGTLNIVSCSSITQVKRLDLIIEILSRMNLNFKWYHIGSGDQFEKIKGIAKEKLSSGSFEFLGNIENSKILDTYNRLNPKFFINLSDSEGIPVSMMEALSLGIPIVGRAVGGIPEIVCSETGLLLASEFNLNYCEAIEEFVKTLSDEAIYNNLHKKCVDFWKENFNAITNYRNFYLNFIEEE